MVKLRSTEKSHQSYESTRDKAGCYYWIGFSVNQTLNTMLPTEPMRVTYFIESCGISDMNSGNVNNASTNMITLNQTVFDCNMLFGM